MLLTKKHSLLLGKCCSYYTGSLHLVSVGDFVQLISNGLRGSEPLFDRLVKPVSPSQKNEVEAICVHMLFGPEFPLSS